MHEHILCRSAIKRIHSDEAVALVSVEPLHGSVRHVCLHCSVVLASASQRSPACVRGGRTMVPRTRAKY
ncbi:hypothetical protein ACFPRL_26380 [Pseudoclavibacter helvolus]